MSQQMNFYLNENDIQKIEAYLKNQGFLFVEDTQFEKSEITQVSHLLGDNFDDRFIFLNDSELHFRLLNNQSFKIEELTSTILEMNYMGFSEGLFRFRFYYDPFYFEDDTKIEKSPEFEQAANQFFEWLKIQFEPIAEIPDFYQNAESPVVEIF